MLRGLAALLILALPLRLAPPVDCPVLSRTHLVAAAGCAPAGRSEIDDVTHALVSTLNGKRPFVDGRTGLTCPYGKARDGTRLRSRAKLRQNTAI